MALFYEEGFWGGYRIEPEMQKWWTVKAKLAVCKILYQRPSCDEARKAPGLAKSLLPMVLQVEAAGVTGSDGAVVAMTGDALISVLRTSTRRRG